MKPLPGRIKSQPEDFGVTELPAFSPEGSGDHLYLWVEKLGVSTPHLIAQLARRCQLASGAVGVAGRKDKQAITRQWVSLPTTTGGDLSLLPDDGERCALNDGWYRILNRAYHRRRLKVGALRGNAFRLIVRELDAEQRTELLRRCAEVSAAGYLVNAYGEQRFVDPEALDQARALFERKRLRGRKDSFVLSVAQAAIFNRYLARRLEHPEPLSGEWYGTARGGRFDGARDEPNRLIERLEAGEIVPLAPMLGRDVQPTGACSELVANCCAELGFEGVDWAAFGKRLRGTWRPTRVALDGLEGLEEDHAVTLRFDLPAGAYATVLTARLLEGRWTFPYSS